MKRSGFVLIFVMMLAFLSMPAFAVDLKISGEFYAGGMYLDRTNFFKGTVNDGGSTAFYFQRLRVNAEFIVSPAVSLVTRFDAMERIWGATRSNPAAAGPPQPPAWDGSWTSFFNGLDLASSGTRAENENIAFDLLYIKLATPVGLFTVGYQLGNYWGTAFGDTATPIADIGWTLIKGPFLATVNIAKVWEGSATATNVIGYTDADFDKYLAGVIYFWKGGEAGLLYDYTRIAMYRPAPSSAMINVHSIQPYVKAQIGPAKVEAEVNYYFGKGKREDGATDPPDTKIQQISVYLDAVVDINKFYVGGTFAYLSGDNPDTDDKLEGGYNVGGFDWNPCLIMWNRDRFYQAGFLPSYVTPMGMMGIDGPMQNAWFGQIRGGIRPIAALNIMASVSYANADKTPSGVKKNYGTEVDLSVTYNINKNLTYMVGAGYLFAGDYFKGDSANKVSDNFLVVNKITLTF